MSGSHFERSVDCRVGDLLFLLVADGPELVRRDSLVVPSGLDNLGHQQRSDYYYETNEQ